jgi:DNA-binding NtrC family response regulator
MEVILLTAYGNIPDGVQAIKNGAFDYLTKGNDNDRIIPLLAQASEIAKTARDRAVKVGTNGMNSFAAVIGKSKPIQDAVRLAQKIAPTQTTVLLLGETGTGKEVFARAIHGESKRKEKPFVALNCSAFTKDLLEGELFGHKAGAYTGAAKDKKGLIELADGGTLFLDEIGELHIDLQAKLLRVLEQGEFIKLGDTKTTQVDVRVVAATNRNLKSDVQSGHFREDLMYRLNTFTIILPALRERTEDISELAHYFLNTYRQREGKSHLSFSKEAMEALQNYSWKGNIRELRNVVERAVILAEETIHPSDLPADVMQYPALDTMSLASLEKTHIQKILAYASQNKTKAAQILGIGIATLYRKLEEYGLPK